MNNDRRKQIQAVKARLDVLKTLAEEIQGELETIRDEEQDYFDNLHENFQGGDRGQRAEEAVSQLEEAIGELENIASMDFDNPLDSAAE